jgi:hypothetical protein
MSLGASRLSAELLRRVVMKRWEMAKQMRTAKPAPTMTRKVTRTPFRAGGWFAGGPGTVKDGQLGWDVRGWSEDMWVIY